VQPTRCYFSHFIYFNKTLHEFQAVPPLIIRSSNCTYSFWCLSIFAATFVGCTFEIYWRCTDLWISNSLRPNRQKKHTITERSKENYTRQMQQSGVIKHAEKVAAMFDKHQKLYVQSDNFLSECLRAFCTVCNSVTSYRSENVSNTVEKIETSFYCQYSICVKSSRVSIRLNRTEK
jgi:hypothetical protein